ncbi:hypothetical protein F0562_031184 [Nyssa sinensis]|uniref:SGTA homodimerisation domain-containing protein n=1 Tax=Nyssa sinensis TaxID=561372 RepID=A0A5J5AW16_9ASTE|nr:hypothetical protein F0562_031184 [Nyssa sinensis]
MAEAREAPSSCAFWNLPAAPPPLLRLLRFELQISCARVRAKPSMVTTWPSVRRIMFWNLPVTPHPLLILLRFEIQIFCARVRAKPSVVATWLSVRRIPHSQTHHRHCPIHEIPTIFSLSPVSADSTACIKLEEYQIAKAALETGASLAPRDSRFTNLIKECEEIIPELSIIPMASDLETRAKAAFIDDHFELAIGLYSQAIDLNPNNAELYADWAQANIELSNFTGELPKQSLDKASNVVITPGSQSSDESVVAAADTQLVNNSSNQVAMVLSSKPKYEYRLVSVLI